MGITQITILLIIGCIIGLIIDIILVKRKQKKVMERQDRKHQSDVEWVENQRRNPH